MPLVVEISVAFSIIIALIVVGIFLFASESASTHGRARVERFRGGQAMNDLGRRCQRGAAVRSAARAAGAVPDDRLTGRLNALASLLTFAASLSLFFFRRAGSFSSSTT